MKILIQDIRTFRYLQSDGTWNESVAEAKVFTNSADALRFYGEHSGPDLQLILRFVREGSVHPPSVPASPSNNYRVHLKITVAPAPSEDTRLQNPAPIPPSLEQLSNRRPEESSPTPPRLDS
jgi:hypothetical protein